MLNLTKTYFFLFCLLAICMLISPGLIPFSDEAVAVCFLGVGFFDAIYNKKFKQYIPLIITISILSLYLIYSLLFCHFNIPRALLSDFFQHIKVFAFFGVSYAIGPKFSLAQKKFLKVLLTAIMAISIAIYSTLLFGSTVFYDIFVNPYYIGNVFLCSVITYMFFLDSNDWKLVKKNILYIILIAIIGLTCGRSKYYGTIVFIFFILIIYKPGSFSKFTWKNFWIFTSLVSLVLIVAWQKIQYYFFSGEIEINAFDDESVSAFARPALYLGMILILIDYPLLGSGFASFGTIPSGPLGNYSSLYSKYGLDKVWGLSEDYGNFIGDAFFPGLAQFGLIGVVLFILCFIWLWRKLKLVLRIGGIVPYATGTVILVSVLIDAIASRGITSIMGEYLFSIIGMILAPVAKLNKKEQEELKSKDITGTSIWNRIFNRKNKEKLIYGK